MLNFLKQIWLDTIGIEHTPTRFRFFNWLMLLLLIAAIAIIAFCEIASVRGHYAANRGWYCIAPGVLFFLAFTGPVLRVASEERDRGIRLVIFWGLLGIAVFVVTFVVAYHVFFPGAAPAPYDRLTNIVPAVVAVWAASLGWYTQHQITMKGHRTTHAFNLIMQMQTNAEYAKNLRAFTLVYPRGKTMQVQTDEVDQCYGADWITRIPALEEQATNAELDSKLRVEARDKILKTEAALAAKYLLNYFEFMARGIKSWDLDGRLLYDTIGVMLVSIYDRTAGYRAFIGEDQRLGGSNLAPLVKEWDAKLRKEEAALPGKTR